MKIYTANGFQRRIKTGFSLTFEHHLQYLIPIVTFHEQRIKSVNTLLKVHPGGGTSCTGTDLGNINLLTNVTCL